MLDRDLVELNGVETKNLKRQVRRNELRFSGDFMFELNEEEFRIGSEQYGVANKLRGPIPDLKIHSQATLLLSGKENDHLVFDTCNRQWPTG